MKFYVLTPALFHRFQTRGYPQLECASCGQALKENDVVTSTRSHKILLRHKSCYEQTFIETDAPQAMQLHKDMNIDVERVSVVPMIFRGRPQHSYSVKLHVNFCCDFCEKYSKPPILLQTNHTHKLVACSRQGCEKLWVKMPLGKEGD
jgi:hypothetical protein